MSHPKRPTFDELVERAGPLPTSGMATSAHAPRGAHLPSSTPETGKEGPEPPVGSRWRWESTGKAFTVLALEQWDEVAGIFLVALVQEEGEPRPYHVGARGIVEGAERLPQPPTTGTPATKERA